RSARTGARADEEQQDPGDSTERGSPGRARVRGSIRIGPARAGASRRTSLCAVAGILLLFVGASAGASGSCGWKLSRSIPREPSVFNGVDARASDDVWV